MCHQYSPVCSGILCKNIRMVKNMTPLKHKVHGMHVGGGGRLLYISWLSTNESVPNAVNQWNTPNLEARTATSINLFCTETHA